jgi:iron(III) transport system ATP-binding protein
MGNFVEVRNLVKIFPGGIAAVNDVSFGVEKGKFLTLLGPSGCGKTTTLRCIAGLEKPDRGEIIVDGEVYNSSENKVMISPDKRNIGMVFQSYAVWPNMNVFDNIAYGLKMKKADREKIREKVESVMELVGLQGLSHRPVTKLSGGQQQRVAVARALVYSPKILLFDEPLSNLDAKLRERMRLELIRLQREIGITSIYVTHDQAEAMVISDEIIVMRSGIIEQVGDAQSIYNQPKTKFVADFIGIANFLEGELIGREETQKKFGIIRVSDGVKSYEAKSTICDEVQVGDRIVLFFRPENVRIIPGGEPERGKKNLFAGEISALVYLGNYIDCRVKAGTKEVRAQVSAGENLELHKKVFIEVDPENCVCLRR